MKFCTAHSQILDYDGATLKSNNRRPARWTDVYSSAPAFEEDRSWMASYAL